MQTWISFNSYSHLLAAEKALQADDYHSMLASIVFSAMSIESYLNEVPDHVKFSRKIKSKRTIKASHLLRFAIMNRASFELKLALAYYTLSGENIPKDDPLFSEIRLLFRIRNSIVHTQPTKNLWLDEQDSEPNPPAILTELVNRKIVSFPLRRRPNWSNTVDNINSLRQIAPWAIELNYRTRTMFISETKDRSVRRRLVFLLKLKRKSRVILTPLNKSLKLTE